MIDFVAGRRFLRRLGTARMAASAALAFLVAFPLLGASRFLIHLSLLFFIWAIVASYWNLLNGYAGITSLGNLGFMALGAYVSAVLAKEMNWSPWVTVIIGGFTVMFVVTVFLGIPVLRLRGIYVALLTLVFADALPSVVSLTRGVTGGGQGLLGIPTFIPDLEKWQAYYIALVFFVIAHAVLHRIIRGSSGLAFVALRDAEDFAVALGVDRFRQGLKVLAISAFVTGMAGGLFAHTLGQVSPGLLGIETFLMVISMWMLGGAGTFLGPIFGALLITFGGEYLRTAGSLRFGVLGGLIVVTIMFFPGGLMQFIDKLVAFLRRLVESRWGPIMAEPSIDASTDRAVEPLDP